MELSFKRLIYKTLILVPFFVLATSYTIKFPEPIFYEINFNDGVTHLWSRQAYYDHYGFEEVTKEVSLRYNHMSIDSLTYFWSKQNYLNSIDTLHARTERKKDSIMKREPFYRKLTLDKYCVNAN